MTRPPTRQDLSSAHEHNPATCVAPIGKGTEWQSERQSVDYETQGQDSALGYGQNWCSSAILAEAWLLCRFSRLDRAHERLFRFRKVKTRLTMEQPHFDDRSAW